MSALRYGYFAFNLYGISIRERNFSHKAPRDITCFFHSVWLTTSSFYVFLSVSPSLFFSSRSLSSLRLERPSILRFSLC